MRHPLISLAVVSGLLAACAQQPAPTVIEGRRPAPVPATATVTPMPPVPAATPSEPLPPRAAQPQPPRQLADGSQVPAVRGLVAAADRALAHGDVELAAVNLERAQRLAPQSALVYQKLATVRLRQKRPAEAEQFARKALGFAGSTVQQAELWRLIAAARQQQGQQAAAQEARARAAALEGNAVGGAP